MHGANQRDLGWDVVTEHESGDDGPSEVVSVKFRKSNPAVALDNTYAWGRRNLGVIIYTGNPRARGESRTAKMLHEQDHPVMCRDEGGKCTLASLCNAVSRLPQSDDTSDADVSSGSRRALTVLKAITDDSFPAMGAIAAEIGKQAPLYRVGKLRPGGVGTNAQSMKDVSVSQVASLQDGVYLVRLRGVANSREEVDHVVCVDANTRLIYDSSEPYAMKLGRLALSACVGDGFVLEDVTEIRQLYY